MEEKKFTKKEIIEMADRCFHRCWHCERYEPCSGIGSGGVHLLQYASGGCYEARDLPWESGHWCPFWGNKHHADEGLLGSLTWDNVKQDVNVEHFNSEPSIREDILEANPEIAKHVLYCDNSNECRIQYFNKPENWIMFKFQNVYVYCETLRRYRYSLVDNRLLYPGANEWIRPMMLVVDPTTLKILESYLPSGDGIQVSFACSPDKNYHLNPNMFSFDENCKKIICTFMNGGEVLETNSISVNSYV